MMIIDFPPCKTQKAALARFAHPPPLSYFWFLAYTLFAQFSALSCFVALSVLRLRLSPRLRLWKGCGLRRLRSLALGIFPALSLGTAPSLFRSACRRVRANPLTAFGVPSLAARICAPIGSKPSNLPIAHRPPPCWSHIYLRRLAASHSVRKYGSFGQ